MSPVAKLFLVVLGAASAAGPMWAQLPFYTDDPAVTPRGTLHFEFFDEFDRLQRSEFPDLRQNTVNFKLNYGLPYGLEVNVDAPYLSIFRAVGASDAAGQGDTNLGIKWRFRNPSTPLHSPVMAASLYIEFPTGNQRQQLSSGETDYWLNLIAQERFTDKTRVNLNLGFLFAGNTSTGVVGIQTTRGHVYTGGISLLHDFTSRLTLGGETIGGIADESGLARSQLQLMAGGQYGVRKNLSLTFGL